ncbi:MAG: hypothetical protein ACI9VS_000246 [Candidatus Binatia bacterium]|jgi:hypothetical protein
MNELTALALELQLFCEARRWRFCIIGGLAVQHWGEPRFTRDVDLTLLSGFGGEESYIDCLLASYEARIDNAKEFALTNRVLLLRSSQGIGIDIALAGLPFEESAVDTAQDIELEPGAFLRLCTAEALLVMKAFANRPQDLLDIRGIVIRQRDRAIDWEYIRRYLAPLCEVKGEPEILTDLDNLRREFEKDGG